MIIDSRFRKKIELIHVILYLSFFPRPPLQHFGNYIIILIILWMPL